MPLEMRVVFLLFHPLRLRLLVAGRHVTGGRLPFLPGLLTFQNDDLSRHSLVSLKRATKTDFPRQSTPNLQKSRIRLPSPTSGKQRARKLLPIKQSWISFASYLPLFFRRWESFSKSDSECISG